MGMIRDETHPVDGSRHQLPFMVEAITYNYTLLWFTIAYHEYISIAMDSKHT